MFCRERVVSARRGTFQRLFNHYTRNMYGDFFVCLFVVFVFSIRFSVFCMVHCIVEVEIVCADGIRSGDGERVKKRGGEP